jgi:hypothetical protein
MLLASLDLQPGPNLVRLQSFTGWQKHGKHIICGNRTLMHLRDIEDLVCVARPKYMREGDG